MKGGECFSPFGRYVRSRVCQCLFSQRNCALLQMYAKQCLLHGPTISMGGWVGGWVGGRNLSLHSDSDHCLMQVCVWVCARAGGV